MSSTATSRSHQVVIIGGGIAGATVAANLLRRRNDLDIAVVDAASDNYYQPAWTLVGGGSYRAEQTRRKVSAILPVAVERIARDVTRLLPDEHAIELDDGSRVGYEHLIVAAGIQINWSAIDGLLEALGKNGVSSNYRYDLAPYTWEQVRDFKGGTAVFSQPAGAIKCPGAPQKALYLAADHFRRQGIKADSLQFRSAAGGIFGVPFYAKALDKVVESYGTDARYGNNLVAVRGAEKIAVFESTVNGESRREEVHYDLLHAVPPQSAPDFIRNSPLANEGGWLDVDKHTLRHVSYPDIHGLGDCTSSPNSKTAAAVRAQTPVVVENVLAALDGKPALGSYDGYAACPITTSIGKVMLCEFVYGGVVAPSFPLDPRIPRRSYWWLNKSLLPRLYKGMLQGRIGPDWHKTTHQFPDLVPALTP